MPYRKSTHEKPRKRVLIIHLASRMRRALAEGWMEAGWDVFEAEGRADGLPLMFQLHPDLISLEVVTGRDDSWDVLYSIRLLTLTPVVVLTDGPPPSSDLIIENCKLIATSSPVSISKIISISKAFWKSVCKPSRPMAERSGGESIVPAS
jgi:chemotaxis response regulator CheB